MKMLTLCILAIFTTMLAPAHADSSYDRRHDDIRRDNRLYQQRQDNIRRDNLLYQQRQDNINRDNLLYQQRQDAIKQDQIKQDQLRQDQLKQAEPTQLPPEPTLKTDSAPEIKTSAEGFPQTQPSQIQPPTTGPQ